MAFEKGNKAAQEWSLENATERFEDSLEFAEEDEKCLSLQDAIYYSGIPYSTFDYLADTHTVLGTIKNNIRQAIIRRINRNALDKNEASPAAASIWRMKQLGEKDQQYIEQETNVKQKSEIIVATKEEAEIAKKLIDKFENE